MTCKKLLNFILDYLNFTICRKSTLQLLSKRNTLLHNQVENLRTRLNQTFWDQINKKN